MRTVCFTASEFSRRRNPQALCLTGIIMCLLLMTVPAVVQSLPATPAVEQWDIFELTLAGLADGNSFTDVQVKGRFYFQNRMLELDGFYDGDGKYKIRFMPDTPGEWRYETVSNIPALDGRRDTSTCVPANGDNHGPMRVRDTFHFAYHDGTPWFQVGTTCYVWNHQGDRLEEETLHTLAGTPFNKLRMCVFPIYYQYNRHEPPLYPFERTAAGSWDFARLNPAFFRHLEQRIGDLSDLGIEADLILFHPYDRGQWGFDTVDVAHNDRYLRYVVAPLAAYRNIWRSLANEYDHMPAKTSTDWERLARIIRERDPYGHLCSIHNMKGGREGFDWSRPWVTHVSIQHWIMADVW